MADPTQNKKLDKSAMINATNDFILVDKEEKFNEYVQKKISTWFIDGGGIYRAMSNRIGLFCIQFADKGIPVLPRVIQSCYRFDLPKIPGIHFFQIQAFFIWAMEKFRNAEAYAHIVFDTQKKTYRVDIPEQVVSQGSVHYKTEETLSYKDPKRFILVVEIHSHNTMSAHFSGTDDRDETEPRFYGVFGKLNTKNPEFSFRYAIGDLKKSVDPDNIFNFQSTKLAFPSEWGNRIRERKAEVVDMSRFPTIAQDKDRAERFRDYPRGSQYPLGRMGHETSKSELDEIQKQVRINEFLKRRELEERGHKASAEMAEIDADEDVEVRMENFLKSLTEDDVPVLAEHLVEWEHWNTLKDGVESYIEELVEEAETGSRGDA